jgi:hypothetical protein
MNENKPESAIEVIAHISGCMVYLSDNVESLNSSEIEILKQTRDRIDSLCNSHVWREKKDRTENKVYKSRR